MFVEVAPIVESIHYEGTSSIASRPARRFVWFVVRSWSNGDSSRSAGGDRSCCSLRRRFEPPDRRGRRRALDSEVNIGDVVVAARINEVQARSPNARRGEPRSRGAARAGIGPFTYSIREAIRDLILGPECLRRLEEVCGSSIGQSCGINYRWHEFPDRNSTLDPWRQEHRCGVERLRRRG